MTGRRTLATRARIAFAGGVAGLWIVAAAATAAPPSTPTAYDGSFAPVVVPSDVQDPAPLPAGSSAPVAGTIYDEGTAPRPTDRPAARQPVPAAATVVKPTPKPKPKPRPAVTRQSAPRTSHSITGKASWYCKAGVSTCMAVHPDRAGVADMYAAAGPRLRRAICGSDTSNCWRGRRVTVNGVTVVLADWCQCYKGQSIEKLIDLYWDAWVRVPNVESGVRIRW